MNAGEREERGGRGEGVGRGGGRRGRGRRRREGSGETEGQFLLAPLPPSPARGSPLPGRLGAARSPSLQSPGWGRERSPGARPRGCQADVVGHLKFTEGGGRVKGMVSRGVCVCVFPPQTGERDRSPPLSRSPRRCPREGRPRGCCSPPPGGRPRHPEWRARARAGGPLRKHSSFSSRHARSRRTGLGLCLLFFFLPPLPLGKKERKKKCPRAVLSSPAR